MLAILILTIEILVSYLLQSTVFAGISIANTVPDLLLIVTVAAGYQNSRLKGMGVGFFCGLLLDVGSGSVLGVYALLYMVIGYIAGHFGKYYVQKDLFFPLGLIAISEFALCTAVYVFGFLLNDAESFVTYVKTVFMPRILYTIVVSVIYYVLLTILYERVINRESEDEAYLPPESILPEESK